MGIILVTYLALAWLVFSKFKLVKWGWLSVVVYGAHWRIYPCRLRGDVQLSDTLRELCDCFAGGRGHARCFPARRPPFPCN